MPQAIAFHLPILQHTCRISWQALKDTNVEKGLSKMYDDKNLLMAQAATNLTTVRGGPHSDPS